VNIVERPYRDDSHIHTHSHGHSSLVQGGVLSRDEKRSAARQLILAIMASGILVLGVLWYWSFPDQNGIAKLLLGTASVLVAVPVIGSALHSLRDPGLHGVTDQLVALALAGAWATGDLLTAALLPIIMTFGHVLEDRSIVGTQEAIEALRRLTRSRARVIGLDGNIQEVDNATLKVGDRVEVRAGDRVPVDGIVREGRASLDTAPITGESVPIDAVVGVNVFGGAINLDGLLRIEVTRTGDESTLGKVIALMQSAERSKPPITRLLERYAGQYIGLVLVLAALSWFVTGDSEIMLAILVAACPCALVLSAPATAIAGIAVAARHGILVRGSAFLEELTDVTSLVIDKTGTLTFGSLDLQEIRPTTNVEKQDVHQLAASLGAASSHPVSRALAKHIPYDACCPLKEVREERGFGVIAATERGEAALGRPELFAKLGIVTPPVPQHTGPIAGVSLKGEFLAWLLLSDKVRPEAATALSDLRDLGLVRQLLLTGDRRPVAETIARSVGIKNVFAEALPEDKLAYVSEEITNGFRPMVVGDGINDSLALKAGVVGIALGSGGADIALASADVILVGSDLRRIPTCVRLSRRCRRTLQINVLMGLGWTIAIMILALLGILGPAGALIAAIMHNLSTIMVLGNAGRLLRFDETLGKVPQQSQMDGYVGLRETAATAG
jgi:heavy metal translocating P-type ATPase